MEHIKKNDDGIGVSHDATTEVKMDERTFSEMVRDEETKKIKHYYYRVYIKDKPTLEGTLTREEMNTIYSLYSNEGAALTRREVAREFGDLLFEDFKRLMRAFSITKASSPLAPHIIEENSSDKLIALTLQNKENTYLKKLESERNRATEKSLKDLTKKYVSLQQKGIDFTEALNGLEIPYTRFEAKQNASTTSLIIYLSDMHIGAYNSSEGVFDNPYDESEVMERLDMILQELYTLPMFDEIIVMDLGDAVDGYDQQTTRSSSNHILPQNMSNKEQVNVYIRVMLYFFNTLADNFEANKIKFYSVGHSNHGGDFEYSIKIALSHLLEAMGIETRISIKPIDHFKLGNKTVVFLHGKDNADQFKNFPLTVNEKMENYFNQYLYHHNITGDVLVVKGDLHQSATTKAKRFKYKSVASLYGSSNWIHANFGLTPWGCDYSLVFSNGRMLDGLVE